MSNIKCNCPWNPSSHAKDCPVYMHEEITRLQPENEALKASNRDLQDWFDDARAAAEKAQARVAVQFDALTSVAVALKDAGNLTKEMHDLIVAATDGSSEAVLLRKQAEAVEAAAEDLEKLITEVEPEDSDTALSIQIAWGAVLNEAQRLRQRADELDAGAGGES